MVKIFLNPLKAELNPICHLLALVGTHHILHLSRIRVNFELLCVFNRFLAHINRLFFIGI